MGMQGPLAANSAGVVQNQNAVQKQEFSKQMAEFRAEVANDLKDLGDELANKVALPKKKVVDDMKQALTQQASSGKEIPPELAAQIVSIIEGQEELEKKKRKRKKFEDKLAAFAKILDTIDTSKLSDEEKKILEDFKKNMKTMKKLSRENQQLELEEENLIELLKKLKNQNTLARGG
ncbi:hypothetical protein DID76_02850 [Candidatus Marinamargulisbacteria bacterium SCGC AG-414-C22]|nr:hypothetical protein DID76_02850 [Candidatus Marinamargulisbacteria bacterium SCGC AG-414-C22]